MNNISPLSNQSYLNKDFQTIYPELLDLIKKLTYKWDPTISNESDPGVLLIKLNAIIADKNNYNIDKNLLECFPDSVTQESNAYKLFGQLGYNMHWYKSATDEVTMKWNSEKLLSGSDTLSYTVPQFTMICDEDKEIVYTLLDDIKLSTNGTTAKVDVIQGVIKDYTFGSTRLITPAFLDTNNRLYFPITNIAENGIFISDANKDLSTGDYKFVWDRNEEFKWKAVDNLYIQPSGTKCYKFGIDQITNNCYIEFPSDISDLMGEGIFVKYLQTIGNLGNVAANRLTSFYSDVTYTKTSEIDPTPNRTISNDIILWNVNSITNGDDPETIDDAYIGYKRRVGTFDTLVTLTDYLNYIVNDDFRVISNGVVADRTNDIQSSYKIMTNVDDTSVLKPIVVSNEDTPEMSPYDLKTYFLEHSELSTFADNTSMDYRKSTMKQDYDKSFTLKFGDSNNKLGTSRIIESYFGEAKAIQHNFINKLPNRPLFYKNKFALNLTIIPNSVVTNTQANEIEKNVYEALYKNLLSKNISFGEELTYETIYDICNNADSRIKAVALDNINYDTYAVIYVDEDKLNSEYIDAKGAVATAKLGLNEILVSSNEIWNRDNTVWNKELAKEITAKNVLAGITPMYDEDAKFSFDISQSGATITEEVERVDTYTEIVFKDIPNGKYSDDVEILNNESLILYAPSLIEEASYSTSVKYVYYTTTEYTGTDTYLPANTDLILERGQYLFTFWKTEDSKDAPYLYAKYGPGTILHSTTRLITTEYDKDKSISNRLQSMGYEGEGQILGDLNDDLYDISDTILTSSKVITIKKINSAKLNDTKTECYWITNNINKDTQSYEMEFEFADSLATEVLDAAYQGGKIYVSNFSSEEKGYEPLKKVTLSDDEKIYILEPILETIQYREYNADSDSVYTNYADAYKYKIISTLVAGDKISCNGYIYKNEELFDDVSSYESEGVIPWGDLNTSISTSGKEYNTLSLNDVSEKLHNNSNTMLINGYRIEKYISRVSDIIQETGTSIFTYRLKTNEYFIYTNDSKDSLYILEDGTTINIEVPNSEVKTRANIVENRVESVNSITLSVPAKLTTDTLYGVDMKTFTDDMWYLFQPFGSLDEDGKIAIDETTGRAKNLESGMIPEVVENQIIKLGAGSQISLQQKSLIYKVPSPTGTFIENQYFNEEYKNLKVSSDGVYVSDTGEDNTWILDPYALLQYSIRYKDKSESSYTYVTQASDEGLSWNAYMILSIDSGAKTPQKLNKNHNHKITLYKKNGDAVLLPIENTDGVEQYIQTNYAISLAGGKNINLTAESVSGDIYYVDVYDYGVSSSFTDDKPMEKDGDSYVLNLNTEFTCGIGVNSLQSSIGVQMILPVKVSENTPKFTIRCGNQEILPIGYDTLPNVFNGGIYYYKLPESGDTLSISPEVGTEILLHLLPIFSFTYNKELSVSQSELEEEIGRWDINKEFDYTYQPLPDKEILNPLKSKDFFNRNHICNKFVIPQISSITIKTMNKRT